LPPPRIENDVKDRWGMLFDLDYDLLLAVTQEGWQRLPDNDEVEVKALRRGRLTYVLARSLPRRRKERAIRRRQLLQLWAGLKKLQRRVARGQLVLRELHKIQIGDIVLETTDGHQLVLRRVARPDAEQTRILKALQLEIPERLSPDRLL
jgi:hypothetical protein